MNPIREGAVEDYNERVKKLIAKIKQTFPRVMITTTPDDTGYTNIWVSCGDKVMKMLVNYNYVIYGDDKYPFLQFDGLKRFLRALQVDIEGLA